MSDLRSSHGVVLSLGWDTEVRSLPCTVRLCFVIVHVHGPRQRHLNHVKHGSVPTQTSNKQMQCIPDCLLKQTHTQNGQLTCSGNCCQHWLFHSSSHPRGPAHALCCSFHHLPGYSENSPSGSPRSQTCRPGHKPKRWGVEPGETPSTSSLEMSTREYVTVSNLVIYPASTNTNTNTDRHRHTNTETRFDLIFYYFYYFYF